MRPPHSRLRLLLLASSYWPEHSPPQRRWYSLIRHLRERQWDVSVVCPVAHNSAGPDYDAVTRGRSWHAQDGFLGETIHRVPFLPLGERRLAKLTDQLVSALASVVQGLFTGTQDVVVVTAPSLPLLGSALLVARLKRRPLVVEMRDAWPNLAEDASVVRGGSKSLVNRAVEYVQNHADLVVTVTEGFARTLRERGVRHVVTVRNGIMLERTPQLPPPAARRERLEVVYLGNHGESQALEQLIRAAALAGPRVRLTLVGHGSRKPALQRLAATLDADVRFLPPEYREAVFRRYQAADSLVISLRDDWKSFEDTIPSKTYEVLAVGRHITGVVRGEAARVLRDAGEGDVVPFDAERIAALWCELAADRSRLRPRGTGREWVRRHAEYADLSREYDELLRATVRNHAHARGGGRAHAGRAHGARGGARGAVRPADDDMTGARLRRSRELARNGCIAAVTAARHVTDDPVVFSLQVSRRLPTRAVHTTARWLARLPRGAFPTARATGLHILGDDAAARGVLTAALTACPPAVRRRCAEVALTMGELDLVDTALADLPPGTRGAAALAARRAWYVGDVDGAVSLLRTAQREGRATAGERALLTRLAAERDLLDGFVPALAPVPDYRPEPDTVLYAVTNSLPHTTSGYAQRTHSLLSAVRDEGWAVHALTRPGYPVQVGKLLAAGTDVVDGIPYHRVLSARPAPTATGRVQHHAEALLDLALRVRPAVLHTTTHYVNALAVQAVARALGIPWVYEVRGLLADTWAATRPPAALTSQRYRRFQTREARATLAADDVVTLGETMAQRVRDLTDEPALPLRLVPNAVGGDFEREPGEKRLARERTGLPAGRFLVGTVTSVVDYEGLDDLLRAVALVRHRIPSVLAVLVGDGVARPRLEQLARDLGLGEHVCFVGRVGRAEAAEYFRALDAFVIPRKDRSVTRTVTPLKPVEAMACGTPVVASDLPALGETVRHGITGLLIPPEDPEALARALSTLAEDPGLSERLGCAGRDWVLGHRTWSAAARATVTRYGELSGASPVASGARTPHPRGAE